MSCRKARAFTLIELLIVVAIISILSAGSMAIVVAPGQERVLAEEEHALEAGAGLFFATLVSDAHSASALESHDSPKALVLRQAASGGEDVVYYVDAKHVLRRGILAGEKTAAFIEGKASLDSDPAVLANVGQLSASRDAQSGLWRVRLQSSLSRIGRQIGIDRQVLLAPGKSWTGGVR